MNNGSNHGSNHGPKHGSSHGSNQRRGRNRNTGKRHSNSRNHNFDSNGPEGKVRGTAQQVLDKYQSMARDATSAGEHIAAEAYYQFAEHYYRVQNADSANNQNKNSNRNQQSDSGEQPAVESPVEKPNQPEQAAQPEQETTEVVSENTQQETVSEPQVIEIQNAEETPESVEPSMDDVEKPKSKRQPRKPRQTSKSDDTSEEAPQEEKLAEAG